VRKPWVVLLLNLYMEMDVMAINHGDKKPDHNENREKR
jgi:hypothetical protein